MSNINISVSNSSLSGNASVIHNLYEAPKDVDFERIEKELSEIKSGLKKESLEFQVVESLEKSSKTHSWSALCTKIGQLTSQFAGATLANLAGSYLSQLFGLGR